MLRSRSLLPWLLVLLCASAGPAWAQRLSEPSLFAGATGSGARALGMGGAFIAIADDATAASWNPAGLCVLERAEASIVFQPAASVKSQYPAANVVFDTSFQSPTSRTETHEVELDDAYDYARTGRSLDFASLTVPLRLGSLKLVPQLSYQRVIDMGLDYDYHSAYTDDLQFIGRNPAGTITNTNATKGGGSFGGDGQGGGGLDAVGASVGIGISSRIYLGLAANFWKSKAESSSTFVSDYRSTSTGTSGSLGTTGTQGLDNTSRRTFKEDFSGTNFQIGLLVKPSSKISVGATFKSGFDLDYGFEFSSGSTSVSNATSGGPAFTPSTTNTTSVTDQVTTRNGVIRWPSSLGGGVAVMPKEFLTFAFDATFTSWSKARLVADDATTTSTLRTVVRTVGTAAPTTTVTPATPTTRTTSVDTPWPVSNRGPVNKQPDVLQLRFGGEYVVRNPGFLKMQVLPIRLGVFREGQLTRTPRDGSEVYYTGLSAGVGLTWSRLSLDFAYVVTSGSRDDDSVSTTESTPAAGTTSRNTITTDFAENVGYRASRFFVSSTVRF